MKSTKIFYGWWIVLGTVIMLGVLGPATVALANVYQAPAVAEFGITNSQFALSNSFVLGIGIFLSPFVSKRLAEGNFKRNYIISLLIYTGAFIGYGFAPNIFVFYLLSILVGYGSLGSTILPVTILINNWFIQKRGLAISLAMAGLGIGGVIFSPLLTFLISQVGWRQTYMLHGALMLIIVLPILIFLIKVKPKDMGLEPYGNEFYKLSDDEEQEQTEQTKLTFSESVKKPFFILLIIGAVSIGISNNAGFGQFPPALTSLHGPTVAATVISVYSAVGIVGKLLLGQISDLHGAVKSTIYASGMVALAHFFMLFSENLIFTFLMAVVFGLGNGIGTVLPPLITSAIFPTAHYSSAYGYVNSGLQLGMTFGSLLAASIADLTGSYNTSWVIVAILAILTGVTWVGAYRNSKKYR